MFYGAIDFIQIVHNLQRFCVLTLKWKNWMYNVYFLDAVYFIPSLIISASLLCVPKTCQNWYEGLCARSRYQGRDKSLHLTVFVGCSHLSLFLISARTLLAQHSSTQPVLIGCVIFVGGAGHCLNEMRLRLQTQYHSEASQSSIGSGYGSKEVTSHLLN